LISSWHDRRIVAGSNIDESIDEELESSQIILLLVSAHFLASNYCYEREMERALQKNNDRTAVVIPVILHPCDWHSAPFRGLRATPTDGKPISLYANQHEAFAIIAKDIREVAEKFASTSSGLTTQGSKQIAGADVALPRSSNLRIKRKIDDHERDEFLENCYQYIARYFEGSLDELAKRNPQLKTRFKRLGESSFTAFVYEGGKRVCECAVSNSHSPFGSNEISYSMSATPNHGTNESLSVTDDGYTLLLKALGMPHNGVKQDSTLTQQGAAEYFWSLFIGRLQ